MHAQTHTPSLSCFLLAAFCFKGFLVIIKTTNPVEFLLFPFYVWTWDMTWLFFPQFFGQFASASLGASPTLWKTVLYSGDEVDAWFLKVKKNQKSLSPSPHTFPLWPWVCVLQVSGTGSVHCPSDRSRCVLAEPPGVKIFAGNHSNYPLCWGAAAPVLRKKCDPKGSRIQP